MLKETVAPGVIHCLLCSSMVHAARCQITQERSIANVHSLLFACHVTKRLTTWLKEFRETTTYRCQRKLLFLPGSKMHSVTSFLVALAHHAFLAKTSPPSQQKKDPLIHCPENTLSSSFLEEKCLNVLKLGQVWFIVL